MEELVVRYLHFAGIILLASMLAMENILISRQLQKGVIRKLAIIDGVYGLAAMITLFAGLTLWLWVGKPKEFYSQNWIFHAKLTLFVVIGLISIVPTRFFLRNRNVNAELAVPSHVLVIKRVELGLLFLLPLLAVFMARGVGLG